MLALTVVLVCPLGQALHTRLLVAVPAWLTKLPGWQLVHALQLLALLVVL